MIDLGLLLLRAAVGSFVFVHGSQKLFGWFGGRGLSGAIETARRKGLRPSAFWGPVAAVVMTAGAVGTTVGFLDPLGPLGIVASMVVIVLVDRRKGFFAHEGGIEHAYLYLLSAAALAISGPGRYSLDAFLGIALPPAAVLGALALAAVALAGLIALRRGAGSGGRL